MKDSCEQLRTTLMCRIEDVFSSRPTWSASGWDITTLESIQQVVSDEIDKHVARVALQRQIKQEIEEK